MMRTFVILFLLTAVLAFQTQALERPDVEFKIFQFPSNKIPCIDGDTKDWDIVPDDYIIGTDQLSDTVGNRTKNTPPRETNIDTKDIDVRVRVGWVKGSNRLYFLYEAYDEFWLTNVHGTHVAYRAALEQQGESCVVAAYETQGFAALQQLGRHSSRSPDVLPENRCDVETDQRHSPGG